MSSNYELMHYMYLHAQPLALKYKPSFGCLSMLSILSCTEQVRKGCHQTLNSDSTNQMLDHPQHTLQSNLILYSFWAGIKSNRRDRYFMLIVNTNQRCLHLLQTTSHSQTLICLYYLQHITSYLYTLENESIQTLQFLLKSS